MAFDREARPARPNRGKRRKVCQFCADKCEYIDYKDAAKLRRFVSERSKILPRRTTGTCAMHQRQLTEAIKRARQIALLHSAGAGGAAGQDLGPLRSEPAQLGGVLIVDALHLVNAEGADLAALAAAGSSVITFHSHGIDLLFTTIHGQS